MTRHAYYRNIRQLASAQSNWDNMSPPEPPDDPYDDDSVFTADEWEDARLELQLDRLEDQARCMELGYF